MITQNMHHVTKITTHLTAHDEGTDDEWYVRHIIIETKDGDILNITAFSHDKKSALNVRKKK